MDNKTRTILLACVLAGILGFAVLRPLFMGPIAEAEARRRSADGRLEQAEARDFKLQQARGRIRRVQDASLPPSRNDAQRLYLEWISDLAVECRFQARQVSPGIKRGRPGKYLSVAVDLEADAKLEDLSRFLFEFEQADLVHRISSLSISSTATSGNPDLEIKLTAEGLSVFGADERIELAARTRLVDPLTVETTVLSVKDSSSFPEKTPFLAKIGTETIRVVYVAENKWTVERGVAGGSPFQHAAGAIVRHFPVAWVRRYRSFDEYQTFVEQSLFTKPPVPRAYRPSLAGLRDQTIAPGEVASVTPRVTDYNPDVGQIRFHLQDTQEGMQIDPVTGQFSWDTPDDIELADYVVTVFVSQQNNEELNLSGPLTIHVRLPNEPPTLNVDDSYTVLLGQPFWLKPSMVDDGDAEDLTYTLEGDSIPDGLIIDSETGVLTWEAPLSFKPGPQSVTLKVTDAGDPPQSADRPLLLDVQDDDARYTRLSAAIAKDGRSEAWLENILTRSQIILHVGDRLTVANIAADVIGIEARQIILQDEDGIWQLALGNPLRDRVLREPARGEESVEASDAEEPAIDTAAQ